MGEFDFEKNEILTNLVLLEDHAEKFPCPFCMEKHASKVIGYAEEIALGENDAEMKKLAEEAREWRRTIQGAKGHSHKHNPRRYLPHGLTACEKKYASVRRKLSRCIKKLEPRERSGEIESAVAVCRAAIKCPP